MTKNILILFAFVLLASTSNWVPLYTDGTLTGGGYEDNPLGVDTSKVATTYDLMSAASGASYDVYTALISQAGTDAPTATVLENTLGTVSFSYNDVGWYFVNCTSCFTADKSIVILQHLDGNTSITFVSGGFASTSLLYIYSLDDGMNSDDVLVDRWIEIRVYP